MPQSHPTRAMVQSFATPGGGEAVEMRQTLKKESFNLFWTKIQMMKARVCSNTFQQALAILEILTLDWGH